MDTVYYLKLKFKQIHHIFLNNIHYFKVNIFFPFFDSKIERIEIIRYNFNLQIINV